MILTFVVDATEDVLGVTRLHHVALTGFFGGVLGCDIDVRCGCYRRCSWCHAFASCGTNSFFFFGGFWGVILTFVVDDTEDVLGVTRLHHVALTGFLGGVLGCDIDVRCGCYRRCSWCHAFASCGTNRFFFGGFWGVILTFVVDDTEDVVGVTRLHPVALTGFFLGGSGVCY